MSDPPAAGMINPDACFVRGHRSTGVEDTVESENLVYFITKFIFLQFVTQFTAVI